MVESTDDSILNSTRATKYASRRRRTRWLGIAALALACPLSLTIEPPSVSGMSCIQQEGDSEWDIEVNTCTATTTVAGDSGNNVLVVTINGANIIFYSWDNGYVEIASFPHAYADTLDIDAGGGIDNVQLSNFSTTSISSVLVRGGNGDDVLSIGEVNSNGVFDLRGSAGDDTLDSYADGDGVILFGGKGADTITGGNGNDVLKGGNGGDTIDGQGGDDTINGGNGQDDLDGGSGTDTLNGGSSGHSDTCTNGEVLTGDCL